MRITGRTKKRLALLLITVMMVGVIIVGGQVLRKARLESALDNALREGTAAYEAGNHAVAMRHLSFYVARRREHEAVLMLADCRRHIPQENRRHIPAAISFARAAVDLDSSSVPAHELLLELYHEAGFATEAVTVADALLALQPGHRRALESRMIAQARLGRFQEALVAAKDLARDYPDDVDVHRQVAQFMQLTDKSAAEIRGYLEESADRAKADFRFALLYAEAALLTGDAEESLARARAAAELSISTGEELAQFLRLLDTLSLGQPEAGAIAEAIMNSEFSEALARDVAIVAAERAWKFGRTDLAWQYIQTAVEQAPSADDLSAAALGWWILLQQASAGGRPDEQVQTGIDDKLELLRSRAAAGQEGVAQEASLWLAMIEGSAALESGDLRTAAERLEHAAALRTHGGAVIAEFLLGHLDRRTGDWRRASERWESLLRQNPNWRSLRRALVSLLIDNGQYEDAIARAQTALGWSRGSPEALQLCRAIMGLLESGRADSVRTTQVLGIIESISQQAPADGAIQTAAARAYLAANRIELARRAIERILDPESSQPPADLVTPLSIAFRAHDAGQAARLLELVQGPDASPDAIYAEARALADDGQPAEARALLERHIAAVEGGEEGGASGTTGRAGDRARLAYQFRLYSLLRHIGDPEAVTYLASLAAEHHRDPQIQTVLLESDAAWQDEALITAAIQRLREASSSESAAWRIHEARRLLTFTPSSARASEAVQILAPSLRQGAAGAADGRDPMALALAGEAYLLLDGRDRALEFFTRAVDAEPARPNFYPRLIDVLTAAGRSDEARRRLTAFAGIDPVPTEHRRLRAQLALAQGSWDLALADYTALAGAPDASPDDRFGLAIVHLRRGQPARAAAILDGLARLPQATPAMLIAAADLRAAASRDGREPDIEAGRRLLEDAPADIPPQLRHALIAAYLQRHGHPGDAESLLIAAANQTGESQTDAIAELARFYLDQGRLDGAREALARAGEHQADHPTLSRIRALLRIQSGDETAEAWAELSEILSAWPDAPPAIRILTDAMHERAANPADTAGHLGRLQSLTRQHPTFYTGWQIYVQALAEAGEHQRASESALAATRALPADPRPAQLAATALIQQQRFEEALAVAAQWRTRSAHDTFDADVLSAWLFQQLSRPHEGLRLLEPWRQRLAATRDPERLMLLAGLLLDAGRNADASRLLWPLVEQSTSAPRSETHDWPLSYIALAARIKEPQPARDWLTRIQPMVAADSARRLALGEAWFQLLQRTKSQADLQQTRSLLDELTTDTSHGFSALVLLASASEAADDRPEAVRHYRAALAQQPDDIVVLNNLAYILAQDPTQGAEAADLAARAASIARSRGVPSSVLRAILDTQGVALLTAARWMEAETIFREALTHDPNAPDLLIGLAEARYGQGDPDGAATLIQSARTRMTRESPLASTRAERLSALEARIGR